MLYIKYPVCFSVFRREFLIEVLKGTNNEINYIFEVEALSSTSHLFTNRQTFAIILCCVTCTNNDDTVVTSYLNFVLDTMNWTDLETIVFDETCFSVLKNMNTNLRYLYLPRFFLSLSDSRQTFLLLNRETKYQI